jgi:hypothetical protein
MWSAVMVTDGSNQAPTSFGTVTLVPAGDPTSLADVVGGAGPHVVVAAPSSLNAELAIAANIASGRWPDVKIATLTSGHAPLAGLSALTLAKQVTEEPGMAVGLIRAILAASWSGGWLHSLARLADPVPTLSQHARSLLPWSGFLVRQAPEPAVLTHLHADDVPVSDRDRVLLVEDGAVPQHVVRLLAELPRTVAVRQLGVPGSWRSVYGTSAGQVALMPAELDTLPVSAQCQCTTCGLWLTDPLCPFCSTLVAGWAGAAA